MTLTVVALLWVVCAGFAALIADRKGRSVGWFVVAGLVLGVVGLLWAAFAKPRAEIDAAKSFAVESEAEKRARRMRAEDRAMVKRQRWPE